MRKFAPRAVAKANGRVKVLGAGGGGIGHTNLLDDGLRKSLTHSVRDLQGRERAKGGDGKVKGEVVLPGHRIAPVVGYVDERDGCRLRVSQVRKRIGRGGGDVESTGAKACTGGPCFFADQSVMRCRAGIWKMRLRCKQSPGRR